VAKVKEALKGDDGDAIKAAVESLNTKVSAISEELYKNAAAAAQASQGAGAPGAGPEGAPAPEASAAGGEKKDDVVDADFEMVDPDKKK